MKTIGHWMKLTVRFRTVHHFRRSSDAKQNILVRYFPQKVSAYWKRLFSFNMSFTFYQIFIVKLLATLINKYESWMCKLKVITWLFFVFACAICVWPKMILQQFCNGIYDYKLEYKTMWYIIAVAISTWRTLSTAPN